MKNLKVLVFGAIFSVLFLSTFTSCENNDVQPSVDENYVAENVQFQNSPLRGPVISIHIGRKKKDCDGFGFCKAIIESALSLDDTQNAVRTSVEYDRRAGAYYVDALLDETSRITDATLVVDEDLTVEGSERLTGSSLSIGAGEYKVNSSLGSNGGYRVYLK